MTVAIKQSNRVVSVLFTEDQLRALKLAAFQEDRSMSKYIGRMVIERLLDEGRIAQEEAYPPFDSFALSERRGDGRRDS